MTEAAGNREALSRRLEAAEAKLARHELAVECTRLGLWDWNVQTGECVFNAHWAHIVGYEIEELAPITIETWAGLCHPEDLARSDALLNACWRGETDLYECECRMRHKSGRWVWVLDRGRVVEWVEEGKPLRMAGIHMDITERKVAVDSALLSGRRFEALFNNIAAGVAVYEAVDDGADFRFLDINPAGARIAGLTREEHWGRSVQEVYPSVHEMGLFPVLQAVWRTGEARRHEVSRYDDGRMVLWAENYVCKLPDGAIVAVYEDVTEAKEAHDRVEAALAESRRHAREVEAMLRAAELTLVEQDFEKAAHSIFDICAELIGAKSGYVAMLSPAGDNNDVLFLEAGGLPCDVDPSLPMPIRGLRGEAYATGKPAYENDFSHSEWQQFMPAGHVPLENVMFAPLVSRGRALGLMGIANKPGGFTDADAAVAMAFANIATLALHRIKDEAAVHESERRVRAVMNATVDAVMLLGRDGTIIDANEALCRRFGRTPEALRGVCVYDLVSEEVGQRRRVYMDRVFRDGLPATFTDERDGMWNEHTIYPVKDDKGAVSHVAVFGRDITAARAAAEEHRRLQEHLLRGQKLEAVGTLAGGIAHDFNNILGAIVGYAELLEPELRQGTQARDFVRQIIASSERAQELVNQILTFTRQDAAEPRPVSMRAVVVEALAMMRAVIPAHVHIEERLCNGRCMVTADPTQLHQVVVNLCTNAYQALPPDGGAITVALECRHRDPALASRLPEMGLTPSVCLRVEDTGCGIDPAVRDRIFDPFFSTKPVGSGTGLGLSTVHGIVTRLNGAVEVESTPGAGSAFTVYLPGTGDTEERNGAGGNGAPSDARHVMLVDDETPITQLLGEMLRRSGYRVTTANDPGQALAAFREHPEDIDLVVTDYAMPSMTGINMAREMRAVRPDLPLLVMTGYSEAVSEDALRELGIGKLLAKPLRRRTLLEAVQRILPDL